MLTRLIQTNGVTNVTANSLHWSEPKMQRKAAMEKVQSCEERDILLLTVRSGPNQWRDSQTPRQILEYWCELSNLSKPQYLGNTQLVLDGKVYNLQEYGKHDS